MKLSIELTCGNKNCLIKYTNIMHKVTEADLKGQLETLSVDTVQKMVDYQVKQGNKANVELFQSNVIADKKQGGFGWDETSEGVEEWGDNLMPIVLRSLLS